MRERSVPYPKRSLGQNFLVSRDVAARIVGSLGAAEGDLVFEIGPGRGALTALLARSGAKIVAYEIDRTLAARLAAELSVHENVEIVERDVREVDFDAEAAERGKGTYMVIGNIPYHLTSVILIGLAFLERCTRCVCMVQREVGERVLASPGERRCGVLSVFLQSYLAIERVMRVRPGSFRPRPRVESVVLRFSPGRRPPGAAGGPDPPRDREGFLGFLKLAFSQRRKRLLAVLREAAGGGGAAARKGGGGGEKAQPGAAGPRGAPARKGGGGTERGAAGVAGAKIAGRSVLPEELSGIDLRRRPEELALDEWFSLFGRWTETRKPI